MACAGSFSPSVRVSVPLPGKSPSYEVPFEVVILPCPERTPPLYVPTSRASMRPLRYQVTVPGPDANPPAQAPLQETDSPACGLGLPTQQWAALSSIQCGSAPERSGFASPASSASAGGTAEQRSAAMRANVFTPVSGNRSGKYGTGCAIRQLRHAPAPAVFS